MPEQNLFHPYIAVTTNPLCMAQFDQQLRLLSLSASWFEKLAMGTERLSMSSLVKSTDVERVNQHLKQILKGESKEAFITVNLNGCGDSARLYAWLDPMTIEVSINLLAMTQEQINVEQELARLRSQNALILRSAAEGIYGLDSEGRATFANEASTRILGWDHKAIIGEPMHNHHHHSHADGSPYPKEDCPIYAALVDGDVHRVDDEVFWHKDGHAVPVEYISSPIINDGQIDGAVVMFRDISERQAYEKQREADYQEIKQLKEELEQERDYLRDEIRHSSNHGEIIGDSLALQRTLQQIDAVANTSSSVLVLGESGVGKEMIARAIHQQSNRSEGPLVKVNCASIPKDLFESEFFGHVRGSFTGAHRDRVGRLQLANGGTLFLDEVGEIPLDLQGKLLRALQEQEFERVGDETTIKVNVRIVAATNKNLLAEANAGRFREDLYYRLSVFPISVPPLRERQSDIVLLAQHFLQQSCRELGRGELKLTKKQAKTLTQQSWPGNIRELKNVMERAVIMTDGEKLRLDLAIPQLSELSLDESSKNEQGDVVIPADILTDAALRELEKNNMAKALEMCDGKIAGKSGAAALLGLKPSTFTYRLERLGLKN